MDRKTIIAIAVCFLILVLYPYYLNKFHPQKPVAAPQQTPAKEEIAVKEEIKKEELRPAEPSRPDALTAKEEEFFIQTDLYNVVMSNYGGTIKRLELKNFKDKAKKEINLTPDESAVIRPLSLIRIGKGGDLTKTVYGGRIEEKKVIFEYTGDDKLSVKKIFYFSENKYEIKVKFVFKNAGDKDLSIDSYDVEYGSIFPEDPKAGIGELGIAALKDTGAVERQKVSKIKEETIKKGPFVWTGIQNQFYAIIAKPATKIENLGIIPVHDIKDKVRGFSSFIRMGSFSLAPGGVHEEEFLFYMGPKEYKTLSKSPYKFKHIFDFGIFGFISEGILICLNLLFKVFRNYGIAIIIITVVIKILLYPFTQKSMKSMKQMQAIQPLITEIREKNKDNPKKMQKEMMMVYKEYKVNPMGGCLPMLAQLPIFIALFNTLRSAIELKGAKFLWVKDLSLPDTVLSLGGIPLNILPLIMGVTMVWQQKLTPTDPSQAKMMMIMPVIFTFMFYSFPSGLVLYWLVNNILSIAQQYQVQAKA